MPVERPPARRPPPRTAANRGHACQAGPHLFEHMAAKGGHMAQTEGVDELIARGNALAEQQQYQEALAAYDRALALDPNYLEAWVRKGIVFYGLRRYQETVAACGRATAIGPNN